MRDGLALAAFVASLFLILVVLVLRAEPTSQTWPARNGDDVEVHTP